MLGCQESIVFYVRHYAKLQHTFQASLIGQPHLPGKTTKNYPADGETYGVPTCKVNPDNWPQMNSLPFQISPTLNLEMADNSHHVKQTKLIKPYWIGLLHLHLVLTQQHWQMAFRFYALGIRNTTGKFTSILFTS